MVCFGVDLYRFSLICNDYFRKVVYKKEKGDEQTPRRVLYRAELHPELRVQMYGFILK